MSDYTGKYTPDNIGDIMAEMLELKLYHSLLEPSAGSGQLIRACKRVCKGIQCDYYEIDTPVSFRTFTETNDIIYRGGDFLMLNTPHYDRIIANPPFEKDVWNAHLKKMWLHLKPNGILVSTIPRRSVTGDEKGYQEFKDTITGFKEQGIAEMETKLIDNWYTNKDGTILPIMILKLKKLIKAFQ